MMVDEQHHTEERLFLNTRVTNWKKNQAVHQTR